MRDFFKFMFASMVGTILSAIVIFILFVAIIAGTIASAFAEFGNKEVANVKNNSILKIDFSDPIVDRAGGPDFMFTPGSFQLIGKMGLNDILNDIEKAKTDNNIKGIYLNAESIPAGFASTEEIRQALLDFKESGKWILSYAENYNQKSYYLASVADEIYVYPEGSVDFRGLSTQIMFLEGMLDKLDVEAQVIRGSNNKFKSAVEPLIRQDMSEANKLQTLQFITSIWNTMVDGISKSRNISPEELNRIADEFKIKFAQDAADNNFVTALAYEDEVLANLAGKIDVEKTDDINFVTLQKYHKSPGVTDNSGIPSFRKPKIAVVYASGAIQSGESESENMGSATIAKAIAEARKDSTVKAIVLRVNSPGGSALASDVIWRETMLAKQTKPLVVSMGDVAASGGYYISCAADKIFAMPNTITGSIGVFSIIPNAKGLFNNKLGITFDGVKTNEYADFAEITRPLTENEYSILQSAVDEIYGDFKGKVSDGRGITVAMVDSVGQGRVWAGADAIEIGLIDEFGGLRAAIKAAAELANIDEYGIRNLPELKDPFQQFIDDFLTTAEMRVYQQIIGDETLLRSYKYLNDVKQMKGMQARIPYYLHID